MDLKLRRRGMLMAYEFNLEDGLSTVYKHIKEKFPKVTFECLSALHLTRYIKLIIVCVII